VIEDKGGVGENLQGIQGVVGLGQDQNKGKELRKGKVSVLAAILIHPLHLNQMSDEISMIAV